MRLRPSPRRAYLGNTLVEDYLRPKAEDKVRFGFYDLLQHSLATFLVSSGTDPKTVRTLRTRSQEGNFERLHWTRVTTGIAVTLAWWAAAARMMCARLARLREEQLPFGHWGSSRAWRCARQQMAT
jgi:hypothetical protein